MALEDTRLCPSAENDATLHERIVRAHERERARTTRTVDWRSFDAGYRAALDDTRPIPPGDCPACGQPVYVAAKWSEWACSDPECGNAHGPGPGGGHVFPPVERLANACACGDCYHPLFGPDTDGEPCDWCQDCGCPSADHTRPIPPADPCRECGPGYRIGDDGCRHLPPGETQVNPMDPETDDETTTTEHVNDR